MSSLTVLFCDGTCWVVLYEVFVSPYRAEGVCKYLPKKSANDEVAFFTKLGTGMFPSEGGIVEDK